MNVQVLCYTCDEREAEGTRYPVMNNFEGWGGRAIGYQCEPCAEAQWEQWEEWRMG